MNIITVLLVISELKICLCGYWEERRQFEIQEESIVLGSSVVLNENEKTVNQILMRKKLTEYDDGLENVTRFLPSRHFFRTKNDVEKSQIFNFIRKLPKGANLHAHDTALVSSEFVFNLTYRDNLYACSYKGRLRLKFFNSSFVDSTCKWVLLKRLRKTKPSINKWIKSQITLEVENPEQVYVNEEVVWSTFQSIFTTVIPLLTYKPVFEDYFYRALQELYEDNVLYIEFRGMLPPVYDLTGKIFNPLEVAGIYDNIIKRFKHDHLDFVGGRLIYAPMRDVGNKTAWNYVKLAKGIKRQYPNLLAGFDLVGEEVEAYPLKHFIDQIIDLSGEMKMFFHAGETKWYGTAIDENLIDAVLLNTTRIGHGYALYKHPKVLQMVKEKGIAIEVNPISNQVLKYVDDMRNHPAAYLIANGYPVVICNDDPSFWGAKGLSYDWYMAFMGIASKNADLRFLKQLAINSLNYSSFPTETEKRFAFKLWSQKWDEFIRSIIRNESFIGEQESVVLVEN